MRLRSRLVESPAAIESTNCADLFTSIKMRASQMCVASGSLVWGGRRASVRENVRGRDATLIVCRYARSVTRLSDQAGVHVLPFTSSAHLRRMRILGPDTRQRRDPLSWPLDDKP